MTTAMHTPKITPSHCLEVVSEGRQWADKSPLMK